MGETAKIAILDTHVEHVTIVDILGVRIERGGYQRHQGIDTVGVDGILIAVSHPIHDSDSRLVIHGKEKLG